MAERIRGGSRRSESRAVDSSNAVRVGVLGAGQAHVVVGVVVGIDITVVGAKGSLVETMFNYQIIDLHIFGDATDTPEGIAPNLQIVQVRHVAQPTWLEFGDLVVPEVESLQVRYIATVPLASLAMPL